MTLASGGILIIDKEVGMTSAAVVSRARVFLGEKRVGHTGTLDPFATGVLPICFGRATAAAHYMLHWDKRYLCGISLGMSTDTMDCLGSTIEQTPEANWKRFVLPLDEKIERELEMTVQSMIGVHVQEVPIYSAVKVDGKRLYRYAREGRDVDLPKREITVHEAIYHGVSIDEQTGYPVVFVEFLVSSGTYIRVLAESFGGAIGCHAHAKSLRRLAAGHFTVEQSVTLDRLFDAFQSHGRDALLFRQKMADERVISPVGEAFSGWPRVLFDTKEAIDLAHGKKIPVERGRQSEPASEYAARHATPEEDMLAFFSADQLIAVGRIEDGLYRVKRVFISPDQFNESIG